MSHLVSFIVQLFLFRFLITLYLVNPLIMLFRMVHCWSFFFNIFIEKSPIYDEELSPSLLEMVSLTTTLQESICERLLSKKKSDFVAFFRRNRGTVYKIILQSGSDSTIIQRFTRNQFCFSGMQNVMRRYPKVMKKNFSLIMTLSQFFRS